LHHPHRLPDDEATSHPADRSPSPGPVQAKVHWPGRRLPTDRVRSAGLVSGAISDPVADIPVGEATRLSPPATEQDLPRRFNHPMLRLQTPLPERYRDASPDELESMISTAKATLGDRLFILGHHYQRDEIMKWADARGDSYRLSVLAQERPDADYIVFCGVHFMAESADILTADHQSVILPDLNAGCSMADMADLDEVTEAWDALAEIIDVSELIPITYMNSSAALKAFVGEHGGAVCTSTNARAVLEWAFTQGRKVLFFPDQHLGRNTGIAMGYTHDDMVVWNPRQELGGLAEQDIQAATFLLWKGHCSVHQRFSPTHVAAFRAENPDGIVIAHPECAHEVCSIADQVGSTDFIIKAVAAAPAGATIAIGTEIHLVNRLAQETPDKKVVSLDPLVCPCSTMFRIDAPHLAWVLENLVEGRVLNQIEVDAVTTEWAKVSLQRMLDITQGNPVSGARPVPA
jgi:quinolinate synthase